MARIITLVAFIALCIGVQGASNSSSCSTVELQRVQKLISEIRTSLESDSSSEAASVLSTCKEALTFDLSATGEDDDKCANDCVAWVEGVVDAPTCDDEEMLTYHRRMAAYLTQCNEHKQVRLQELESLDGVEHSSRLRGLAAGNLEERKLGVKGLMDALLVVTLNNAL